MVEGGSQTQREKSPLFWYKTLQTYCNGWCIFQKYALCGRAEFKTCCISFAWFGVCFGVHVPLQQNVGQFGKYGDVVFLVLSVDEV